MHFFTTAITAIAALSSTTMAAPAADKSVSTFVNTLPVESMPEGFDELVEKVEAIQNKAGISKRQPGGITCTFFGGQPACIASCLAQTGNGGFCADETNICTCFN